jgi:hypothetical protein
MPTLAERYEYIQGKVVRKGDCLKYGTRRRAYLTVDGVQELVYRIVWRHLNGDIPKALYVLHKCDNGLCVNPEHLELGTQRQNMLDAVSRGCTASASPVPGISWQATRGRWLVMPRMQGKKQVLYCGKDFFEACCVRRSFEATQQKGLV